MKKTVLIVLLFFTAVVYSADKIDYFDKAKDYMDAGKLDLAYENLIKATNQQKIEPEVYLYLGKTAYRMKKYHDAFKALLKAFSLFSISDVKDYLFMAAQSAAFIKKYKKSKLYLKKIIKLNLEIPSTKINRLKRYINYRTKEKKLKKAAKNNGKEQLLKLAKFYLKNNYDFLAAKYYLKAFNSKKNKAPWVTNEIAKYFLKKGMKFQAKKLFLKTLEANRFDKTATYYLGKMYFNEKNYKDSARMFQRMKRVTKSYIPYLYLGEIYANTPGARFLHQSKILAEAIGFLKKAEKRGARSERLYLLLSYLYKNRDEKQYKKYSRYAKVFRKEKVSGKRLKIFRNSMKIKRLTELLQLFKKDSRKKDILYSLAKTYSQNEQYNNAKNTILKVIKQDKSNFRYYNILGYSYYKLKNLEKAIIAFKNAIHLNKTTHKAYYYLAKIHKTPEYYNYNRYINYLKLAIRYSRNNEKYLEELSNHYLKKNDLYNLRKTYIKLTKYGKKYKEKIKRLSLIIKLMRLEKDFSSSDDFNEGLKQILDIRLQLDGTDKKIAQYLNRAGNLDKNNARIKYYKALYNYSLFCNNFKKKHIQKSIKILKSLNFSNPYFEDTYYLLSMIYLHARINLEKSLQTLELYKKRCQGYDIPYINNVIAMIKTGLFNETGKLIKVGYSIFKSNKSYYSLDYLLRAHNKDEKNERLLLTLGEIYKKKKDFEKAIFYYKKAVKSHPWNPGVYLALGNAYFAKFLNTPKDIHDFNTNYDKDKTFPESNYALSKLKENLNKARVGAINAYRTYIKQRSPFIVHDLHPQYAGNLVRYLERLRLKDNFLKIRLGFFLLKNDKIEIGMRMFKSLREKEKRNKFVLNNILKAYKLIKDYKSVTKIYGEMSKLFPRDYSLHLKMSKYYMARENLVFSLKSLKKAYSIRKDKKTELLLGDIYYEMGKLRESEKYYEIAFQKYKPHELLANASSLYNLAVINNKKGDFKKAVEYYEKSLTAIKQHTFTKEIDKYNLMLRKIYLNLSKLNLYTGEYRKAFNWLIEARIFDTDFKHKYEAMIGDILFLNKRFKYAIAYYKNALKKSKNDRKLLFRLAVCYREINQNKHAFKILQNLYKKHKEKMKTEAILLFGDLYMINNQYSEALKVYKTGLIKNSENYKFYVRIAQSLKFLNRPKTGINLIRKNLYIIKNRANIYSFLAWYMAERDIKIKQAVLWAKKAVLMHPKNITFLKTLAFLYFKTGHILKYFRTVKIIEQNYDINNVIKTDYFNYFYSYQKACEYFHNQNYTTAIAKFNNNPKILKLQTKITDIKNAKK